MAKRGKTAGDGVQSVGIAAMVLGALAAGGGVLPLRDLAQATGMPRAKVHRYLAALRAADLVAQDADGGHYRIGPAAITIGLAGLRILDPAREAAAALPKLRQSINETVTAAIWGDAGPTIIAIEESDHLVTMNVRVGSVLPVSMTAIGRVFAAYLPPNVTRPLIVAERKAKTGAPNERELARLVAEIRRCGTSFRHGALIPGVDAVAAPVFDHKRRLAAVLCAVSRSANAARQEFLAKEISAAARSLSRRLGFSGAVD